MIRALLVSALLAGPVGAQQTAQAPGALLRGLDKISGQTFDLALNAGQTASFGPLLITLRECRFPAGNRAGDAYAGMQIRDGQQTLLFDGWMIASAPALSAMDHLRYDIWVIRCTSA